MDTALLVAFIIAAVVVVGAALRLLSRRSGDVPPRVVTQNLDYSILGQRPEIVVEDDPEADIPF